MVDCLPSSFSYFFYFSTAFFNKNYKMDRTNCFANATKYFGEGGAYVGPAFQLGKRSKPPDFSVRKVVELTNKQTNKPTNK